MVLLEYKKSNGYVVFIHETIPNEIGFGNAIIESDSFNVGDEVKYYIEVGLEPIYKRNEDGELILVDGNPVIIDKVPNGVIASIQQAPAVLDINQKIDEGKNRIDITEQDILITMQALTELYEELLTLKGGN